MGPAGKCRGIQPRDVSHRAAEAAGSGRWHAQGRELRGREFDVPQGRLAEPELQSASRTLSEANRRIGGRQQPPPCIFSTNPMAGFRVRRALLGLIFAFAFTGYVQRTSISIAAERMMPELGLSQIQVGWLLTAFLFTYAVFQVPGALVGQRLGPRRALTVIGLATVIATLGTVVGAGVFGVLLAARALLGVAQAALFPVGAGTIRSWFPVNSWASAQALVVTGLWSGAAATPALVAWLMEQYGWRLADRFGMRVVRLVALPLAAVFLYLTVTATSPYWAVAMLCLGFGCVELTEGSYWGATMRRAPSDTMAATAFLNTGGNLGGVVATPIIAALSASYSWTAVFATGAVCALVAAGLWLKVR